MTHRTRKHFRRQNGGALIGAVWMFGLAYLAFSRNWWPGILILIGITILAETLLTAAAPATPGRVEPTPPQSQPVTGPVPTPFAKSPVEPVRQTRADLPDRCPNCGGPTGPAAAHGLDNDPTLCHYCGSRLVK